MMSPFSFCRPHLFLLSILSAFDNKDDHRNHFLYPSISKLNSCMSTVRMACGMISWSSSSYSSAGNIRMWEEVNEA